MLLLLLKKCGLLLGLQMLESVIVRAYARLHAHHGARLADGTARV